MIVILLCLANAEFTKCDVCSPNWVILMNISHRTVNIFRKDTQSYQSVGSISYQDDLESCLALARRSAYGANLDFCLPQIWEQLLKEKRIVLVMIEEEEDTEDSEGKPIIETRSIGFRIMCFITEQFYKKLLRDLKTETLEPPIAAHLFKQHGMSRSPILTRREIAHSNAFEGLHVFAFSVHDDEVLETSEGVIMYARAVISSLVEIAKGYQCQSAILESYSIHARKASGPSGFDVVTEFETYYNKNSNVPQQHHLFISHVHRDQFSDKIGAHVVSTTRWNSPILDLSMLEKETLDFMLAGASDKMLEQHYDLKNGAIRKRVSGILAKIRKKPPPELAQKHIGRAELLEYLREHREETRPYDASYDEF